MNEMIKFEMEDGKSIIIESDKDNNYRGSDEKTIKTASDNFTQALEKTIPVIDAITDQVKKQKNKPDEITVEFGIKIGGNTNLVIATATAEANFKFTLKWVNIKK